MPILFNFENQQLLVWLVEFQEGKAKFSIYKLMRYTTDLMEAHPDALVIPTVLFTDRKKWHKSVLKRLHAQLNDRLFLHFEYVFHKLFDLKAQDYYNMDNPVVKILLPKMNYRKEDRIEVIRQAYAGLFHLVSSGLFDKYVDFIDMYAEIGEQEQLELYDEIVQHKETAMLAQYIRAKGVEDGVRQGVEQGVKQGVKQGVQKGKILNARESVIQILELRFGKIPIEIVEKINRTNDPEILKNFLKQGVQAENLDQLQFRF